MDLEIPMKLFTKVMIAVLFIALLLPFTILKDDDGDTLVSFSDFSFPDLSMPNFSMPDLPKLSGNRIQAGSDEDLDGKDVFYKWYDADGNVQFTTEPPPEGVEYTLKGFDPDTNVIQSVKLPSEETKTEETNPTAKKSDNPGDIGNPYSADTIEKLFEDTKNIEKLLQQRLQDQQSMVNQ